MELVRRIYRQSGKHVRYGAEVGVFRGETSALLLHSFPKLTLAMIDPWEEVGFRSKFDIEAAKLESKQNTDFAKDRRLVIVGTSEIAAKAFLSNHFDFVFVDANHTYEKVREDVRLWWPKVKVGGALFGHDYNGRLDRKGKFGVKKAVDEFCEEFGLKVHICRFLIWKIEKRT